MYADAGKSGLRINGRDGLQELIADVQALRADFTIVLVYDVSRWGRFQDTDEGAYYEYICRKAGIQVIYCAEPFANDGSAIASVLKGIKRTMAAEYSRELSARVFAAQCRFAAKGFKMGGLVGYGLRRISYDRNGQLRRVLESGERKASITDRVRIALGTPSEIATIKQIYTWYLDEHCGDTEIADRLNQKKIRPERGDCWKPWHVKAILTNEKYMGRIVFNRGTAKLSTNRTTNPQNEWISVDEGLPQIITSEVFQRAIDERRRRMQPRDRTAMIVALRALYGRYGYVTAALIDAEKGIPGHTYFSKQFGTLADAYLAADLPASKTLQYARTKHAIHQTLLTTTVNVKRCIEIAGGAFTCSGRDLI